jgi:hypothetical protein
MNWFGGKKETALTVTKKAPVGPLELSIEKALIGGDLSSLRPEERLSFYNRLCLSLKLNPLTKPFEYIVLNGKLQLYAKKDCTEQLRKIHGVSITSVDPKQIGDLLVVVAEATDRQGRVDSATGAVNLSGLKGEALANAMMKAETKAKRRVTLSLCGLGMLDETEVATLKEQGAAQEPTGNKWESPQNSPAGANIAQPTGAPVATGEAQPSTQGTAASPAASQGQQQAPQEEQGTWFEAGDRLTCILKSATDRETKVTDPTKKPRPYLNVTWNGRYQGFNGALCWHQSLFDAVKAGVGKEITVQLSLDSKFLSIEDVLVVDGVKYWKGKPAGKENSDAVANG